MKWREDSLVRSLTALNELKMMSRYATDAVLFLSSPQVIFQQRPLKTIYDLFQRSVRDGNFFFLIWTWSIAHFRFGRLLPPIELKGKEIGKLLRRPALWGLTGPLPRSICFYRLLLLLLKEETLVSAPSKQPCPQWRNGPHHCDIYRAQLASSSSINTWFGRLSVALGLPLWLVEQKEHCESPGATHGIPGPFYSMSARFCLFPMRSLLAAGPKHID